MAKDFKSLAESIRKRSNDFVANRSILPVSEKAVCIYLGKNTIDIIQNEIRDYVNYVLKVTYDKDSIFHYSLPEINSESQKMIYDCIEKNITGGYDSGNIFVYFISLLEPSNLWDELDNNNIISNVVRDINRQMESNGIENIEFNFIGVFPFMSMDNKEFFNNKVFPVLKKFNENKNTNIIHLKQVERGNIIDVSESIAFYICSRGAGILRIQESSNKGTDCYCWHNFHVLSKNIIERIITSELYKVVKCRDSAGESPDKDTIHKKISKILSNYVNDFTQMCLSDISDSDYKYMPIVFFEKELIKKKFFIIKKNENVYIGNISNAYDHLINEQEKIVNRRKKLNKEKIDHDIKDIVKKVTGCCDRYNQFNDMINSCINEIRPNNNEKNVLPYDLKIKNKLFYTDTKMKLELYIIDEIKDFIDKNKDSILGSIKDEDNKLREYIQSYMRKITLTSEMVNDDLNEKSIAFDIDYLDIANTITNDVIMNNLKSDFNEEVEKYYNLLVGNIGSSKSNRIHDHIMFASENRYYAVNNHNREKFTDNIQVYINYGDNVKGVPTNSNSNIKENTICVVYDNFITNYLPWE